jgi:UDP-N-acetylmuramate--alanine ligase
MISVVTNIEADHMETYGHDFGRLKQTFVDFLHRLPFYGVAVLCLDDPHVREIMPRITKQIITYGFAPEANVRAENIVAEGGTMRFDCVRVNGSTVRFPVVLNLPGLHNVQNALATIAVASEVGVPDALIVSALAEFKGVGRRFQRYGELPLPTGGSCTLIDDYGHHPAEMAATLAAARGAFPGRRILLAFQPHRYTRTRDCFEDFVKVLSDADGLLLTEVYAAGEAPVIAADGRSLARALRVAGRVEPVFVEDIAALPQAILDTARNSDVVITMGAGSIGAVAGKLMRSEACGGNSGLTSPWPAMFPGALAVPWPAPISRPIWMIWQRSSAACAMTNPCYWWD